MTLINTDGMAFIGPGSEWFWTALSGFVLAVTFLAIYRQLRLARGLGAIEQMASFAREWESERMLRHRLEVLIALRDGTDPAQLPVAASNATGDYWDRVGTLARGGHLNRKVIDGANCQLWWATLAPNVRKVRSEWGDPKIGDDFEWLAGEMAEMNRRDGTGIIPYEETLVTKLEGRIAATRDAIHVEQALRTVILASPGAGVVTQPAPSA
jgi:hypothetical protein